MKKKYYQALEYLLNNKQYKATLQALQPLQAFIPTKQYNKMKNKIFKSFLKDSMKQLK